MAFEEQEFDKLRREVAELKAELKRMKEFTSSVTERDRLRYITKGVKGRTTVFVAPSSGVAATTQLDLEDGIVVKVT